LEGFPGEKNTLYRQNGPQHRTAEGHDAGLSKSPGLPPAQGLYDPRNERDNCGMGFVANMRGEKSHEIIEMGIEVLIRLTHRGASGCDPETGDGAGILIQIPHEFFAGECKDSDLLCRSPGNYAVGMVFLPVGKHQRLQCEGIFERIVREEGLSVLGWRDTPCDGDAIGREARATQPYIQQIFLGRPDGWDEDHFERKLYVTSASASSMKSQRRRSKTAISSIFRRSRRAPSSTRACCWRRRSPISTANWRPAVKSALCVVHQRFSTNTFPSWPLAHPYRYIAHNGEINTLRGNVNWMKARESLLQSPLFGDDLKKLFPIVTQGGSDSAAFDSAVELLFQSGRSLPHVMAMLIPEAWSGNPHIDPDRRAFYEYHASLMEPWDGPAAMAFTDGRVIGAMLDRNGLRPGAMW
jgi:glutamate synthase (NADPH/NADH) large chain